MNVDKLVLVPVQIEIADITLLSIEEYEAAKENIPPVDDWWWLRSPGFRSEFAACVDSGGGVCARGNFVYSGIVGVRPALRVNPTSLNLQIREKVQFDDCTWTYVAEGILLCDKIIRKMPFRNNRRAKDANNYKTSDVKRYIGKQYRSWKENEK